MAKQGKITRALAEKPQNGLKTPPKRAVARAEPQQITSSLPVPVLQRSKPQTALKLCLAFLFLLVAWLLSYLWLTVWSPSARELSRQLDRSNRLREESINKMKERHKSILDRIKGMEE